MTVNPDNQDKEYFFRISKPPWARLYLLTVE